MNRLLINSDDDLENYIRTKKNGINKLFIDRVKDLEDYIRNKKNGMKICFHCEEVKDFNNNIKLIELFKTEIGINNIIAIGYKGGLKVMRLENEEYNKYKSLINNEKINNKDYNDLLFNYYNNSPVDLSGRSSSEIITTLILYYTKIYLDIPYSEKDEEKKKGIKWDANKKKWYIYHTNNNLDYFIDKYKITDETYSYIDEYIKTKITKS